MTDDTAREQRSSRDKRESPRLTENWQTFEEPTTAVVEAVATVTDRAVLDLPPLQHYVDADGLNAVLEDRAGERVTELTFSYCGLDVTVDSAGRLDIWTPESG